jgi:hypothetical protein
MTEPTENQRKRMERALSFELGIMTESEELDYLQELIKRYPELAADFIEGSK